MKLSQFKFKLPEEQIAQYPCAYERDAEGNIVKRVEGFDAHRDECRLMVLHAKSNRIEHRIFKELIEYFGDKDLFVFNDTQVFPALMHGNKEKTNALIEVFLLRELNQQYRLWDVLVEPARKIRVGNKLYFGAQTAVWKFLHDEKGDVNVVSLVVLIGVAVVLALVFRTAIKDLIDNLMEVITTNAGEAIKKD